jgi:preprotein translocase subunit SecE
MKSTNQSRTTNKKNLPTTNVSHRLISIIRSDFFLWLIVIVVFSLVCFLSIYSSILISSDSLKAIFVIFGASILLFVAKFTNQGKKGWKFLLGARSEMRKVTWPTYREIINSTFVIIVAVFLSSVLIYFVGFFFMYFMHWILK